MPLPLGSQHACMGLDMLAARAEAAAAASLRRRACSLSLDKSSPPRAPRILALGFFDRGNLGDDCYRIALSRFLGALSSGGSVTTLCMDEASADVVLESGGCDMIVVGGGDVINPYFMDKLRRLLGALGSARTCPCYALSVGIPYPDDARYLDVFDHVFVRSRECFDLAVRRVGADNVTLMPDLVFTFPWNRSLPPPDGGARARGALQQRQPLRLGLCLAQPVFAAAGDQRGSMVHAFADMLARVSDQFPSSGVEFHLIPFNTGKNPAETDLAINSDLHASLMSQRPDVRCVKRAPAAGADDEQRVRETRAAMSAMDGIVCMRFHSIVFSLLESKPFFVLHTTHKVRKAIDDLSLADGCACFSHELPKDASDAPSVEAFACQAPDLARRISAFFQAQRTCNAARCPQYTLGQVDEIAELLLNRKRAAVVAGRELPDERVLLSEPSDRRQDLARILQRMGPSASPEDLARAACFVATRDVSSRYWWGLMEKIADGRIPRDDVSALWNECCYISADARSKKKRSNISNNDSDIKTNNSNMKNKTNSSGNDMREWRAVCAALPPVLGVTLDTSHIDQQGLEGYHRSGWAYATFGLRALEPQRSRSLMSTTPESVIMDTYVDRTFHWGCRVLEAAGVIPYTRAWAGFVHHTFDETYSAYNCRQLMQNACFLASLRACRGLIVLTRALRDRLAEELAAAGFPDVPVLAVPHPTEFPGAQAAFTMTRFLARRPRRLVHVGAWLRQPYTFFGLQVPLSMDGIGTAKYLVKGPDMGSCLPPCPDMLDRFARCCLHDAAEVDADDTVSMCRSISGPGGAMCRDDARRGRYRIDARTGRYVVTSNKFVEGLLNSVQDTLNSVTVVERLSNDDYDALLSDSVVFLHLTDAAAVNTVIECMARNTPLLVNRLPGLEEMLGKNYPGFYRDAGEAAAMAANVTHVSHVHAYLARLNKSGLELPSFVRSVHDFLAASVVSAR